MTAYLVLVLIMSGADTVMVSKREFISASSPKVCQEYADKLAEAERQRIGEMTRGMRVVGTCSRRGLIGV